MRLPSPEPLDLGDVATFDLGAKEELARPTGPQLKVLLLEDREDFRGVLHDYLVSCSHHVTQAESGIEGLREIMRTGFDLIICDMMMPRMGGENFYWAVTRVRPAAGRRFIFFTGHQQNPALEFFFQRVKATVLFKPFKFAALDAAIREVLRKLG